MLLNFDLGSYNTFNLWVIGLVYYITITFEYVFGSA